ncbi:protein LBH-like isoform X1 [Solea solea]|uniref:protein LBH-like isoform X1 n=2 Tax=Solea solea TaxID=90069 RepID=UPI00272BDF3F|nr:protein LBH-like isoform X1 [Solea solea]
MSCTASHSVTAILSQAEMEEGSGQRRDSRAFQIFPEAAMSDDSDSYPDDFLYRRERLPSIVVEPTALSDSESESENSNADHSEASLDGEQPDDSRADEGSVARKSSIGPSQSQLSLSRLNPPACLTRHEAAPPCVKT